ncbi:hypothetical protein G9A89_013128 [Geosiphon pyriformis]|nr:hypothetical protein G9A89_013128 [Geosiphon pyriformis]
MHTNLLAGHFEKTKTIQKTLAHYYWPILEKDIAKYIKTCNICQRKGKPNHKENIHLISIGQLFNRIEASTGEKRASKSLKKLDRPSKLLNKEVVRTAQIEAALRKCDPEILGKINKEKSVEKFDEQMDNLFETNKDIANLKGIAEDMEDSELGLLSRITSPSPNQKSSKILEKNAMAKEANQEEE